MKLSICIPVYNGAKTVGRLIENAQTELQEYEVEFVLVNDGSHDNSDEVCTAIANKKANVKYICLRRNFGEHNAVMCALNYCTGDYAVIIDDDFQNPPAEIKKLIYESLKENFDVVYARYNQKKDSVFRNLGSRFNDIISTWLLNKPKDLYLCSFKLIKKEVIGEIIKYKGPFPYIDGLILRCTSSISSVCVEHLQRKEGRSNYTFAKLVSLWLNMFINFSIKPLRIVMLIGFITALACMALAIGFVIEKIMRPEIPPRGWATMAVIMLFIGGIQMFGIGLVGEYIGKNYLDKNGTPQWVVKKEIL
ncbi:glycosyl transferase [Spirochaetia bacterium]|nr:glycosyl transferase [Spirochaetia bacterium]